MVDKSAKDEKPIKNNSTETKQTGAKKGLSIIALVFGILGLVLCWVPYLGLICCLVGIIIGIIALVKKNQKGTAIAGLICGIIGIIPALIISFITGEFISIFSGISGGSDAPKPNSGWTTDYLEEVVEEKGIDYSDVPQEYIDAFNDFEACLSDAGVEVSSWDEFENLSNNVDNMTYDQAKGLLDCAIALSEFTENSDIK